ncbi:MAG: PAS domain S-box protein [Pseudomonadota bacterium]
MNWQEESIWLSSAEVVGAEVALDIEGQEWLALNAASVLDAVVDAIVTMDASGNIQSVNQATEQLFGYSDTQLRGQKVTLLMPEPYRSSHQGYVENYLNSGKAQIIGVGRELSALHKDGYEFPIYLAVSEIPGQKYFVGIIRDLTEQKAAHTALAEQKERVAQVGRLATMGEMTASIAHEINQPLTAIAMYAQAVVRLLGKSNISDEKIEDAIHKISSQALRAGAVIERIQRFVHNESGERVETDLNQLISEIDHLAQGDARLHGVTLSLQLSDDLPAVLADPIQIQQVLLNLVRNGIDAMYEIDCRNGNTIIIHSCCVDDRYVEVSVHDCGLGVQQHDDQVFAAFQTTKPDGMGMGLAICKSIMEDHGGSIGFYNKEGNGAVFSFRLPIKYPDLG